MRRVLRRVLVAATTGALTVSAAWAGTSLGPVDAPVDVPPPTSSQATAPVQDVLDAATGGAPVATRQANGSTTVPTGSVLAGAAKVSIEPDPEGMAARYPDRFAEARWERDRNACATLSETYLAEIGQDPGGQAHLADTGSPWPENPDCIYMGGYGIGPMNPITRWDTVGQPALDEDGDPVPGTGHGLWVRAAALGDGQDTVVLVVVDGEGYFWDYATRCERCGSAALAQQLAQDLGDRGVRPENVVIAATHSHTSPDFIGGWGHVPEWYFEQVADAILTASTDAVTSMQPARLEIGEERARPFNHERRDTYRAAEEQQLTWLRAYVPGQTTVTDPPGNGPNRGPVESTTPPRTIVTVGAYAAHPTTADEATGQANADWPGVFEDRLEQRFGGVALHLMTGLGNLSASGGTLMGAALADLIPDVGTGHLVQDTDVRATQTTWRQPATNVPLTALGFPGFFDRQFDPVPASLRTGEEPDTAPCVSASAVSVEVPASAIRVGSDLAITAAPGEIFANFSNTVKEKSGALVTMPLGQANDALGYMPQSFELNEVGQQGLGFVAGGYLIVNYEDSYAVDRCFGDHALETTLDLLAGL